MHKYLMATTCAVALSTCLTTGAMAQAGLEEIVVTARKTAEKLQDVPLTVTAFSEAAIESAGMKNLTDLQSFTPGLTFWQNVDRGYGQIMFRGMNNSVPTGDTTREAASVFIDGIYFVGNAALLNFDDIERVEVVKGPQSAFFGRATFGGAINFVSKTPADTFKAKVKTRIAQYDDYEIGASAEGPIVAERLAARVSADYHRFGGQYYNPIKGQSVGRERDTSVSTSLHFTPTDDFVVKGRFMYQNNADGPAASALIGQIASTAFGTSNPGQVTQNCGPFGGVNNGGPATLYCGVLTYNGTLVPSNANNVGQALALYGNEFGLKRDFYFGSLSAEYTFGGGWSLASLTGYTKEEQTRLYDYDRTGTGAYAAYAPRSEKAFSQEVRLTSPQDARLRGLLGGYYFWQDNSTAGNFIYGPLLAPFGIATGNVVIATPSAKTIRNTAVFGALSFDVLDNVTASVEGRWQRDNVVARIPGFDFPAVTKVFLPRFILDYKPVPNVTLYANVSKGNKPTQANQDIVQQPAAKQAILAGLQGYATAPEEKIWNYELGGKTTFWENRGLLNVAVYYANWTGKQGTKGIQYDFNGNGVIDLSATGVNRENFNGVVYPAGDAKIYGIEATSSLQLTDQLNINASIAYAGNDITKLEDDLYRRFFGTLDASNQEEPRVSKWSGNASVTYRDVLSGDVNWFARVDEIFIGSKWESILNKARTGDAWKTNIKLGIENGRYNITFFVDNLFNNKTIPSLQQQGDSALDPLTFRPAAYEVVLPRLRQVGVTATYSF